MALLLISAVVLRLWRRDPYLAVGWLWYLGALIPVIGFVQVGTQAMADRYTYVPLIGILIMVAWGIPDLIKKWKSRKIVLVATSAAVLAFSAWKQVGHWRNSVTIFEQAVAATQTNPVAHYNLGYALHMQGRYNEAIPHFAEAVRIAPTYNEARNMLVVAQQAMKVRR